MSTTETFYDATGSTVSQNTSTYAPGGFNEYTETEVLHHQGTYLSNRTAYTRQDSVLHFGSSSQPGSYFTSGKLDARQLKLVTRPSGTSTGAHTDYTFVFSHWSTGARDYA